MQNSNTAIPNEEMNQSIRSSNIFKTPVFSDKKKLKNNNSNENTIIYQAQTSKYH